MSSTVTNERRRISALRELNILDTPREPAFDRITSLLARSLAVQSSCVSLVDEGRIWVKSGYGLDVDEFDREPGLCEAVVLRNQLLHLQDASSDPVAGSNSLVRRADGIRFYLGAPLHTKGGEPVGVLCAFDSEPRGLTGDERALVEHLARLASYEIQNRSCPDVVVPRETARVLVVDDDTMILTLVRRALEKAGFTVLTAADGTAAIELVRDQLEPIDAVILDSSFPAQEFVQTLSGIIDLVPQTRVILSGTRARDDVVLFSDLDTDSFLEKPFGPDQLLRVVRQALER